MYRIDINSNSVPKTVSLNQSLPLSFWRHVGPRWGTISSTQRKEKDLDRLQVQQSQQAFQDRCCQRIPFGSDLGRDFLFRVLSNSMLCLLWQVEKLDVFWDSGGQPQPLRRKTGAGLEKTLGDCAGISPGGQWGRKNFLYLDVSGS